MAFNDSQQKNLQKEFLLYLNTYTFLKLLPCALMVYSNILSLSDLVLLEFK